MLWPRQHCLGLDGGRKVEQGELEVGGHDRWLLGKVLGHRGRVVVTARQAIVAACGFLLCCVKL